MILIIGETGERLTVQNWYAADCYQLTNIEFTDGTVWTKADINARSPILRGTNGNNEITGTPSSDTIYAGAGDDTIYAGTGDDTIIGGAGQDYLQGDDGHDIYVWSLGDGNDTIDDYSYNKLYGNDTGVLSVGAEVDPLLIELTRNSNNLVCEFTQTGEFITVQNWYSADYYQLTSMNFANGTTWTRADINAIASKTLSPFSTNQ
jgi:Ca2+-binding RTX toxin-like protein